MNSESASKFISALVKALQTLCHGYVEFNDGIEIIGHIYLNIDSGASFDYIVKEKLCKNAENSTVFVSKSFQAQTPAEECSTRKGKNDEQTVDLGDPPYISPTAGTSRIQSAITSISNVLSQTQHSHKSRLLDNSSHHSTIQNTGKRKREHNGNFNNIQPPFKYMNLQASSSSSSSSYFGPSSKLATDRNHSEHFSNPSHSEFFGGDSNQSSGMGADDDDDLHLDVTFVKEEYESQRNSGQRGVNAASRLSQDLTSSHSNLLHDGTSGAAMLGYSSSHHHGSHQQFASNAAADIASISDSFQDSSQVDVGQNAGQGPPNPRTLLVRHGPVSTTNHLVSPTSPDGCAFDLSATSHLPSHAFTRRKGIELLHTMRQTKWAVTRAREWLSLHGMNVQFEQFSDEQIDQMLLGFYTSGQKKDGAPFSATALLAFRTAINRYLNNKCGRQISIATSHCFKQSNRLLSRLISTSVKVNKTISVQDIKLMYTSGTLSNSNPEALLYKVWFELQMQFRGKIEWSKVHAEHFFFSTGPSGKLTVTWNTCGLGSCSQMTVFEASGGRYCLVESLRLYMEHHNHGCKLLLQLPASKDYLTKGIWYQPEEIREYREKSFMKKISSQAKLSQTYTNACVLNSFEDYLQALMSLSAANT